MLASTTAGTCCKHPAILLFGVALLLGLSGFSQAQAPGQRTELFGVRHVGPRQVADSNALFAIGMNVAGASTFTATARVTDNVSITGTVRPEAAHVGQRADIFVVERYNVTTFTMRVADGRYVPWAEPFPSWSRSSTTSC